MTVWQTIQFYDAFKRVASNATRLRDLEANSSMPTSGSVDQSDSTMISIDLRVTSVDLNENISSKTKTIRIGQSQIEANFTLPGKSIAVSISN